MSALINLAIALFVMLSAAGAQFTGAQFTGAAATWGLVWIGLFAWLAHAIVIFFQEMMTVEISDDDNDELK